MYGADTWADDDNANNREKHLYVQIATLSTKDNVNLK